VPVRSLNRAHFGVPAGVAPSAPSAVTSITADAAATVSFLPPADQGSSAIVSYTVTPYIGATPQAPTTVAVGSTTTIVGSNGSTYRKVSVTGLTNSTSYTFTVKATNSYGAGPESVASGANTPLAGLVFGDEFNGPAGENLDPEWWVYDRCGYLAQNEVQWYKPSHCVLTGDGRLQVRGQQLSTSGPRYPSDPSYPGTINQPWRSGACQSNTRLYAPASGNTMTFEARFQVNANAGVGYWPGFFWLEGQTYLNAWKTDPLQEGWDDAGKAEIDVAEWYSTGSPSNYGNVSWAGSNQITNQTASGLHTSMHTFSADWKPGVNVKFYRDGTLTATHTSQVPSSNAQFFLMFYMQMLSGAPTTDESCFVEWCRVYDRDLG
jgi:Fibronectin type III domain